MSHRVIDYQIMLDLLHRVRCLVREKGEEGEKKGRRERIKVGREKG